ncbi:MAG: hypothetical protein LBH43_18135 [Treponema sp.]|nr:hypothetical protein [Treponema sp.]
MEKQNPWNMTKIDLGVFSAELYRKSGINTGDDLSLDDKASLTKAIRELAGEWELNEQDIEAVMIYEGVNKMKKEVNQWTGLTHDEDNDPIIISWKGKFNSTAEFKKWWIEEGRQKFYEKKKGVENEQHQD